MRKRIWQRWHNPTGCTAPVFLVGCGRSGTTMLIFHLNRLWEIDLYNEDHPAAFQNWRLRDLTVIEELINHSYASMILFKPILDTYRTHVLLSRFPKAKTIFAFRHYDDVVNSSLKKFGTANRINHVRSWIEEDFSEFSAVPPPEETKSFIRSRWKPSLTPESGAALYWLFQNRLFFDLHLDKEVRVKLVSYESLVRNPEREFKSLCQFLELPCKPTVAQGVFASSIGRDQPSEIDSVIRADCEKLWQLLCKHKNAQPEAEFKRNEL